MKAVKKSKWFFWSFVPFCNFAAWVHAGIRTGRNSYYWYAVVYGVPFAVALGMGMVEKDLGLSKETVERVNDVGGTAAAVLWIVGMIHALLKKDSVDQQIQAYDDSRMQGGRVVASSPPLSSVQGSANRGENVTAVGEPGVSNAQVVALGSGPLSGTVKAAEHAGKTFRYVDAQGNVVGPATLGSLRVLRQAGIVCDTTQVIDEEARRSIPLEQLLGVGQDAAQPPLQYPAPSASQAPSVIAPACTPPPPLPVSVATGGPDKPWYKSWWGISIIAFGCLIAIGNIGKIVGVGGYGKFYYSDARVLDLLELGSSSIQITRVFKMESGGESQIGTYKVEKTEGGVVYMTAETKQYVGGMAIPGRYVLAYDKKADTVLLKMVTSGEAAQAIKEMGLSDSRLFEREGKVLKE